MIRALLVLAISAAAAAQTFETASIKLSDPVSPETSWRPSAGMLRIKGMSLKRLIMNAYDVKGYQVSGGPKWIDAERYDIVAKSADADDAALDWRERQPRLRTALRQLLADRFRVVLHEETRPAAGYALVVAKAGLRLKPAEKSNGAFSYGRTSIFYRGAPMDDLAGALSVVLEMPVVNRTGVDGVYDFRIEFAPVNAAEPSDKPSIFTALQESLGLKLESQKVPLKVLVVEGAEKPEAN